MRCPNLRFYVTLFFCSFNANVAITGHWIDDNWELQEALLDFVRVVGTHRGVDLAPYVESCLERYGILDKLFCITTDNASNNDTLCKELSVLLERTHGNFWDARSHNVRCLNHIINLAVQSFMVSIKSLVSEEDEDVDSDAELEEDSHGEEIRREGFAKDLFKLHTIAKV